MPLFESRYKCFICKLRALLGQAKATAHSLTPVLQSSTGEISPSSLTTLTQSWITSPLHLACVVRSCEAWLLSKSLQTINAREGAEKKEPSYTVGGNAN